MPINDKVGPGDISIHRHSNDCKEELSGKYAEYIDEHRDALIAKCERVNNCIDELLQDENILLLLKGDNLSLNKTCGLIYEDNPDNETQSGKCKSDDREDISDDLEQHLTIQFDDVKASGWRNVKKCLENNYGEKERTTYVNDICRLAYKQPQLCENRGIHKNVTTFFNNQIQHLQCTCRSLLKSDDSTGSSSFPIVIGGLVGGLFLLLAICAAVFIFYIRRKSKKSKKSTPNVIYLPAPNADSCPVYQDLFDDQTYQGYGKYPSGNPPALPKRYAKQEDDSTYLEPVEAGSRYRPKLPVPGQANPSYGAPPEYSERDTDKRRVVIHKADTEDGYFEPLPNPPERSDKTKPVPENAAGYETIEEVQQAGTSTEDSPMLENVSQAPIPVKRSGNSFQGEPRYVVLEKDNYSKATDTTV